MQSRKKKIIERLISEFVGGFLLSLIVYIVLIYYGFFLLEIIFPFDFFGGCKSGVFLGIFLCLPLGSYKGIVWTNQKFYEFQGSDKLGGIIALLLNVPVGIVLIMLFDKFSPEIVLLMATLFITIFSMIGFHYKEFLKHHGAKG